MPIKNLTLGLCLLMAGSALAQNTTYKVREGDTLSGIAQKFSVRQKAILRANDLASADWLRVGRTISIPNATVSSSKTASHSKGGHTYTVRNGDFDWAIAKRNGLTVSQLHSLNPNIDWDSLQVGTHVRLPGGGSGSAKVATKGHTSSAKSGTRSYTVKQGENDWIIARRAGVKVSDLRKANPGVNLSKIHPGQTIKLPAGASSVVAKHEKINRIHTSYALVNSDDVSIRRVPGGERITTVDTGTRARVLDREGQWYKLRFPKGTEAWVRGDYLNPAHAERVAKRKKHRNTEERVASRSRRRHGKHSGIVASNVNSDDLLEVARGYRGVRYSYASASRSATDCSGFTMQVYKKSGVNLPHSSQEQARYGQHVSKSDLKPGDLLIFAGRRGGRVGHVGIYKGNGKFIHASSGKGQVTESSLSEGYYAQRLKEGRRLPIKSKKKAVAKAAPKKVEAASHADPTPTVLADGGGN